MSKKTYLTNKIVLIGDARVGKTSLVRRFVSNMFDPSYKITLGTTIMKKVVDYLSYNVTLAIWDIGGQEVFRQIRSKYFFGSKGALAICDASNYESFKNLPSWIESFKKEVGDKPIIFLANKCDLKDQKVTEDDMKQLVKDYSNTEYMFTSAKDGTNTEKAFINLTRLMVADEDIV